MGSMSESARSRVAIGTDAVVAGGSCGDSYITLDVQDNVEESRMIGIIIPAYNEELTIGSIVALSKKYGDVIVVDDGSSDRTSEIARSAGAHVIRHEQNKGKGEAIKTGTKYALSRGYDIIVTVDADGQHDPDRIPLLVKPLIEDEADLVIGSRYVEKRNKSNIPFYRRVGLWILNKGTQLATDVDVDSQSGFRAYSASLLKNLSLDSNGYSVETDLLFRAKNLGARILEVPVTIRYDVPNRHKYNPIMHGLSVLMNLVRLISCKRPLLMFGLASLVFFIAAVVFLYWGLGAYYATGKALLTQTIAAGIFFIIATQLLIAGIVLNLLSAMVKE